jgi:hypothetical protein
MKYKVISLTATGRPGKIYRSGQIIDSSELPDHRIQQLLKGKFIEEHPILPTHPVPFINGKIKVAIVTAVWKRPEIFEIFAKGVKSLIASCDMDIYTIVAGSEGDVSREMVRKHNFIYTEVPNDPLATKVNKPVLIAGQIGVDYVLCVGSDDIITSDLMHVYAEYMNLGYDYIGVTDFYFYDTASKKAAYWGGYRDQRRQGHTAGAGRLISSRLMQKWNWNPWEIKDSKVLDNSMQNKLKETPHSLITFSLKEKGVYALDIKSSTNMTPFALWDNTEFISCDIIKQQFPFVCAE